MKRRKELERERGRARQRIMAPLRPPHGTPPPSGGGVHVDSMDTEERAPGVGELKMA